MEVDDERPTTSKTTNNKRDNPEGMTILPTKKQRTPEKLKVVIIGDSNTRKVIRYLQDNHSENIEWTYDDTYKTAEELYRDTNTRKVAESYFRYDFIIISMGTNDIRKGHTHDRVIYWLIEACKNITKSSLTFTRITTLPPMNTDDHDNNTEMVKLNRSIKKEARRPIILRTHETKELRRTLEQDGYHIRHSHANDIAEELTKATSEVNRDEKAKLRIQKGDPPHIIGKGGKNIADLRDTYRVRINIEDDEVTIKGERAIDAKEEIMAIIESVRTYKTKYGSPYNTDTDSE